MEKGNGLVEVKFNHKVVNTGQNEDEAWVDVEVGEGETKEKKRFVADYVVGCDGATSAVRKALFGREWPGQTFASHLLVQNVCTTSLIQIRSPIPPTDHANRCGTMALRSMAGMAETTWWTLIGGA